MDAPPIQRVDRTWDVVAHLSGLLLFTAIPFGHILGPLGVWLLKRNSGSTAEEHAREALNFQISITIYSFVAFACAALLCLVIIGIPIFIALILIFPFAVLLDVILMIMAALRASNGDMYRYPVTIRMV